MKICIVVPTHDTWKAHFGFSLAYMMTYFVAQPPSIPSEITLDVAWSSILPSSRQDCVNMALAKKPTHVLWCDSDMKFPHDSLHCLLKHDLPIVAANYITRRAPNKPVAQDEHGSLITSRHKTGIQEVRRVGLGLCLMKLEVLKAIEPPHFMFGYTAKKQWLGEDVFFFSRAKEHGYTPVIDHDLSNRVSHIGDFEYDMECIPEFVSEDSHSGNGADLNGKGPAARPGVGDVGAGVGRESVRV